MSKRFLLVTFQTEEDVVSATNMVREQGYTISDVYTPYAVHGLDRAMGLRRSRLPWACFALGITGAVAKLWFQIWTSATSWPVNVGGKPLESVPAFVPVTFEIMVLFAGVGTVLTFFFVSKLRPGKRATIPSQRVTDDRFVMVLEETDAQFDVNALRSLFMPFRPESLEERVGPMEEWTRKDALHS